MGPTDPQDRRSWSEPELDNWLLRFDALKAEIARLTTERDNFKYEADCLLKWRQRALSAEAERDVRQRVIDSQDWEKVVAENNALQADLAAARVALLDIQRTVHKHMADRIAEETLARLGTGEKR